MNKLYIQSEQISSNGDVLSDILHATRLEARMIYRTEFVAPWGIALSSLNGASFHFVQHGSCWLHSLALPEPLHLQTGDLVVLPNSVRHELKDDLHSPVVPVHELVAYRNAHTGRIMATSASPVSSEGITTLICGDFVFEQGGMHPLFSLLPPLIHIRGGGNNTLNWIQVSLQALGQEIATNQPGSETVISRLTDIMFIMVLRHWIEDHAEDTSGWLSALHDPRIAAALGLLHRQPEVNWTVEMLSTQVNMSRSALAGRFTQLVGEPPLKYLTRWRIQLAINWLLSGTMTIEEIARRVGYTSVYAFSKAFKRLIGRTPSEYRRIGSITQTNPTSPEDSV